MFRKTFFIFITAFTVIAILFSSFFVSVQSVFAQTATTDASTQAAQDEKAILEAQLAELQKEIDAKTAQLNEQKKQTGTIQKDVNLLISQINTAKLKIQQKTLEISQLNQQISQKGKAITDLGNELDREHDSLRQLIKKTDQVDQMGAAYVLLSADSVSKFYRDLDDFLSIKQSLYASVNKIKQIKSLTEDQKEQLLDQQSRAEDAKNTIESQKKTVESSEKQKSQLLAISKGKEKEYQTILAQQQAKAAEIRSRLFQLAGGSKAIPFGDAYQFALAASAKTGVEPAFTLAILTQESNLGKNVGTCNRAGDPPSKKWQNIMPGPAQKAAGKSSRDDQSAFLRITKSLGLDPETTPLSCPLGSGGWGGAMGPGQFIPTTWELIQSRVAAALGKGAANPWSAQDAIMGTSIYLMDRGGAGASETNQRNAACKYYSGRACDGKQPANSFYGNSVMALKRTIQADIDYLEQYGVSRR
jgi:membrane-bound lytic murein transglycosylase B